MEQVLRATVCLTGGAGDDDTKDGGRVRRPDRGTDIWQGRERGGPTRAAGERGG